MLEHLATTPFLYLAITEVNKLENLVLMSFFSFVIICTNVGTGGTPRNNAAGKEVSSHEEFYEGINQYSPKKIFYFKYSKKRR